MDCLTPSSHLIGAYLAEAHPNPFILWTYKKWSNPLSGRPLHPEIGGMASYIPDVDFEFLDQKIENGHQALELAISSVRDINQRCPEHSSGLDVVHMTKEGIERVLREPILR